MKNPMIIVVGPTAVGKSTFIERALSEFPQLADTVTFTTRAMRVGESEGHPYHFVGRDRFEELKAQGFFVESATVHGRLYGTPLHQLEDIWAAGRVAIMDVDVQGAKSLLRRFPEAQVVFILPPSLDEMVQRLVKRQGIVPEDLDERLKSARIELAAAKEFQRQIINDDLEKSYGEFRKFIEELLEKV